MACFEACSNEEEVLCEAKQVFKEALKGVLTDEAFKVPSAEAKMAVETAVQVMAWMEEAKPDAEVIFEKFINHLFLSLLACFTFSESSMKTQKEKMWKAYHQLRISSDFKTKWVSFLDNIITPPLSPSPIFFQHVTDLCFKELIMIKYPILNQSGEAVTNFQLTFEEANALRYAAGYICYKLRKQLEASKNPRKSELLTLIENLIDDGEDDNTADDWVKIIDRGGLCHISEHAYMFFVAMEEEVQLNLKSIPDEKKTDGFKEKVLDKINSNEYVKSYWSDIANDAEEDDANTLLGMITRLWITIRGFAYVSAWVEAHKQACKKGIQKSKALRNTL